MNVVTWDNGSLTAQHKGNSPYVYASQTLGDKGKYYCEFLINELASPCLGIAIKGGADRLMIYGRPDRDTSYLYIMDNESNTIESLHPIRGYQLGDIVSICIDIDNSKISYYCNNSHCYTAEFLRVTLNGSSPILGSDSPGQTGLKATANFGATPFKYPIPEGYTSYDGNQSNASKYLLKDDEGYKNLTELISTSFPTEEQFQEKGMRDIPSYGQLSSFNDLVTYAPNLLSKSLVKFKPQG